MDENILAGLALDESIAFAGVEPLHCSLFFHCYYLALSYLRFSYRPAHLAGRGAGPRLPLARTNKRLQGLTCSPVERVKRNHKSNKRNVILPKTGIHCPDGSHQKIEALPERHFAKLSLFSMTYEI